jgi:hypothetical protein
MCRLVSSERNCNCLNPKCNCMGFNLCKTLLLEGKSGDKLFIRIR